MFDKSKLALYAVTDSANLKGRATVSLWLVKTATGGITPENAPTVTAGGANGVCVMSALMTCADPHEYLSRF